MTTYEEELSDTRTQARQDLLDALQAASARLREMTDAGSAIGIREATEAIVAVEAALAGYDQ